MPELLLDAQESFKSALQYRAKTGQTGALPPANYPALSGGGDDGAFGAGLLCGWTAAGTRPEFKLVTGISTGALMAPFAFLGPKYDEQLKAIYTNTVPKDILTTRARIGRCSAVHTWTTAPGGARQRGRARAENPAQTHSQGESGLHRLGARAKPRLPPANFLAVSGGGDTARSARAFC